MTDNSKTTDLIRNAVTANFIERMNEPGFGQKTLDQMAQMPDVALDMMAKMIGIPAKHHDIYRDMMRGIDNEFTFKLGAFQEQLETGDIILVTGTKWKSKALVAGQKICYLKAKSSHVVVVHADFMCIDATPDDGVANRTIMDALDDVEDDWRVIRLRSLNDEQKKEILKKCAYYLQQPYKILPRRMPIKNYSYCSELARKVYSDSNITKSAIPKKSVVGYIAPCDFDKLADKAREWEDVTEKVRPFIHFSIEYKELVNMICRPIVNGLKLNKSRSEERAAFTKLVKELEDSGKLSKEASAEIIGKIKKAESEMNYQFWDSSS